MPQDARQQERPLWFCLYLPRLGLELFTRSLTDEAAAKPAALIAQHRLCQLNSAAQAQGLHPGQSLATAQSICPGLAVAWREVDREAAALAHLADWAWRFTPRVSLAPPDALLLEISGSLRLFRGLDRLQQQILTGIRELGYSGLPGMAPTPLAAVALARAGLCPDLEVLAAELDFDPLGCEPLGNGSLRQAWTEAVAKAVRPLLAHLPLDQLDLPAAEQQRLMAMGLRTVADLLRLPRKALGRRFGRQLLDHLDRLTGRRPDPREPVLPAPAFNAELHFLEDVSHKSALAFPMRRLIGELANWLRVRQLASNHLRWTLSHPRHGEGHIEVRCAEPQRDPVRFLELSRLHLERSAGLPEVAALALRVEALEQYGGRADTLFPLPGEEDRDPTALIDLISARLGREACFGILPANDHLPEQAWRTLMPGRVSKGDRKDLRAISETLSGPESGLERGPRPLWLLDPPQPLTSRDGRPYWHGALTLQRGPERLDVMPWSPARLPEPCLGPRDYWVAQHRQGGHCWIFQNRRNQRWFLHGLFA
ncbi:MAG: DNA polymerase Y family protein [Gammaproteobacteria bacterium]|nr:DNA polymerase Y family protein [Gammaproteobacteria bacterium]